MRELYIQNTEREEKMLFKDFKKYAKSKRFTEKEGELFIDLNDLGMIEWEGGKRLVIDRKSVV